MYCFSGSPVAFISTRAGVYISALFTQVQGMNHIKFLIRVRETRSIRRAGHVARIEEVTNATTYQVGEPKKHRNWNIQALKGK